jgi:hypothetical protein
MKIFVFLAWLTQMQKDEIAERISREYSLIHSLIAVSIFVLLYLVRLLVFKGWHGRQWLRWTSLIIILVIALYAGPPIAEAILPSSPALSSAIHAQEMINAGQK